MSDLRAREAHGEGWDRPVVELVEEERVVGIVYLDGDTVLAEFDLGEDDDAWAFEVTDLQTALDTARAMLLPEGTALLVEPTAGIGKEHPVDRLAAEFDEAAVHRGDEDEGFYPPQVAGRLMQRVEALGLAVVTIEGFRIHQDWVEPIPGMSVDVGDAYDGELWPVFQAGCNVQAMALLERWAREPGIALALEVGDADGDRYVM